MNFLVTLSLLFFPLFALSQENQLTENLWCFKSHFLDSLTEGEIIEAHIFLFDNDPIRFKKNGKFKLIPAPVTICATKTRKHKTEQLKGKWNVEQNQLTLEIKKKKVTFLFVDYTDQIVRLKAIHISNRI